MTEFKAHTGRLGRLDKPVAIAMGPATASWDGRRLTVTTGDVVREWKRTDTGLQTRRFALAGETHNWVDSGEDKHGCDWHLHLLADSRLELTDVLSGETWIGDVDADGCLRLQSQGPGQARFLRYTPHMD